MADALFGFIFLLTNPGFLAADKANNILFVAYH